MGRVKDQLAHWQPCDACKGRGYIPQPDDAYGDPPARTCRACGGDGGF